MAGTRLQEAKPLATTTETLLTQTVNSKTLAKAKKKSTANQVDPAKVLSYGDLKKKCAQLEQKNEELTLQLNNLSQNCIHLLTAVAQQKPMIGATQLDQHPLFQDIVLKALNTWGPNFFLKHTQADDKTQTPIKSPPSPS